MIKLKVNNKYGNYDVAPLYTQYLNNSGRIVIDNVPLSQTQIKRVVAKAKEGPLVTTTTTITTTITTTTMAISKNKEDAIVLNSDRNDNDDDNDDSDGLYYMNDYEPDLSSGYWTTLSV